MTFLDSLFSLKGKKALVTGAAKGNGRAMAEGLLQAGARVLLVDLMADELEKTTAEFCLAGLTAQSFVCDLTEPDAAEKVIAAGEALLGGLDILVNNAGVSHPHESLDYPLEVWRATLAINLEAPFRLCQEAARSMKKQGGGSIINVTSLNAELAFPDNPAYMASKGGLKQLTRSFALDLAPLNIRVNNIGPGYIHTDMTHGSWSDPERRSQRSQRVPLGRWGDPQDLVGPVVFLASDAASYVTGQDLYVDGGWLIKGL